jgi:hypothetical protein
MLDELGADKDVSATLICDTAFVAERPLYFNCNRARPGRHDVLDANDTAICQGRTKMSTFRRTKMSTFRRKHPASTGHSGYHHLLSEEGTQIVKEHTVGANSRKTVDVITDTSSNPSISAKVTSDAPVMVERPLYFNFTNSCPGGHDGVGFSWGLE